jgi:hypothetical protein
MSLRTAPAAAAPVIAAFYVAVILAPSHRLTLLITGTLGLIACWIIAERLGPDTRAGGEMIPIFLASVGMIVMPGALQPPISGRTAVAMGLGILAIEATWAAHRFPVFPAMKPQGLLTRTGTGIISGLAMAFLVALLATVALGFAFLFGGISLAEIRIAAPRIYGGYFLGGAAAGLLVGLLRPITR